MAQGGENLGLDVKARFCHKDFVLARKPEGKHDTLNSPPNQELQAFGCPVRRGETYLSIPKSERILKEAAAEPGSLFLSPSASTDESMSYAAIKRAWEAEVQSHTQKLVLAALASFTDDKHSCYPSISTLAKRCHLSERNVQKQLRQLVKLNLVEMHKGGGRKANLYQIRGVTVGHPTPVTGTPQGSSSVTPAVAPGHPICNRTSIEHSWKGNGGFSRVDWEAKRQEARENWKRLHRDHFLLNSLHPQGGEWRTRQHADQYQFWRDEEQAAKRAMQQS